MANQSRVEQQRSLSFFVAWIKNQPTTVAISIGAVVLQRDAEKKVKYFSSFYLLLFLYNHDIRH